MIPDWRAVGKGSSSTRFKALDFGTYPSISAATSFSSKEDPVLLVPEEANQKPYVAIIKDSTSFCWPDSAVPAVTALEKASHEALSSDFQKYNQKMRQLAFNLKNSAILARRLAKGELEPLKIFNMTPNELKDLMGKSIMQSGMELNQVMLLGFVLLGRSLEERARIKASSDMNELLSLISTQSRLVISPSESDFTDDSVLCSDALCMAVPTDYIRVGDSVLVLPGEIIPVDMHEENKMYKSSVMVTAGVNQVSLTFLLVLEIHDIASRCR